MIGPLALLTLAPSAAFARTPAPPPPAPKWDQQAEMYEWASANITYGYVMKSIESIPLDFTGDGIDDTFAGFVSYAGGNGAGFDYVLFENRGGHMVFRAHLPVRGYGPRDIEVSPGRIRLTTTVARPGDAHCCWTGIANWDVKFR